MRFEDSTDLSTSKIGAALKLLVTLDFKAQQSPVYSHEISSEEKHLVDRGQRRTARLAGADRNSTVTQVTSLYNCVGQKSVSGRTAHPTLRLMGYNRRTITSGSSPVSQGQKPEAGPELDS